MEPITNKSLTRFFAMCFFPSDDEADDQVEATLQAGLRNCQQVSSKDASLYKLEKYLASWLERKGKIEESQAIYESSLKQHGKSYPVWLDFTQFAIRNNDYPKARSLFKMAATRLNIDWQEAVLEAWILFETYYGSSETMEVALNRVQGVREAVAAAAAKSQAHAHAHAQVVSVIVIVVPQRWLFRRGAFSHRYISLYTAINPTSLGIFGAGGKQLYAGRQFCHGHGRYS